MRTAIFLVERAGCYFWPLTLVCIIWLTPCAKHISPQVDQKTRDVQWELQATLLEKISRVTQTRLVALFFISTPTLEDWRSFVCSFVWRWQRDCADRRLRDTQRHIIDWKVYNTGMPSFPMVSELINNTVRYYYYNLTLGCLKTVALCSSFLVCSFRALI